MKNFRPTPQPEITKREEEIWQEITDFIKKQGTDGVRLGNEGLASTVETLSEINLDKIKVSVNVVNEVPKINIVIGDGTQEGKRLIEKAIIDFVVDRYPEVEIEFN